MIKERFAAGWGAIILGIAVVLLPALSVQAQSKADLPASFFEFLVKDEDKPESEFEVLLRGSIPKERAGLEVEYAPDLLRSEGTGKFVCSLGCLYDIDDREPVGTCGLEYRIRPPLRELGTFGIGCVGECRFDGGDRQYEAYLQLRHRLTFADVGLQPAGFLGKLLGAVGLETSFQCAPEGSTDFGIVVSFGSLF